MKLGTFIQRIFSEPDGTPSNKRLIASYTVFVYSIVLLVAFFLAIPLTDSVIHMADVLLGSSIGNYVVGRFAEKKPLTPLDEPEPEPEPSPKKTKKVPTEESETPEESSEDVVKKQ